MAPKEKSTPPAPHTLQFSSVARGTILVITLLLAILWTPALRPLLIVGLGYTKTTQPISAFPELQCQRVRHPALQACEDMYFSASTRQVVAACSDPAARSSWLPNVGILEGVARRSRRDALVLVESGSLLKNQPDVRVLTPRGFKGELHLAGFTVLEDAVGDAMEIFAVNNKPAVDPVTGEAMWKDGANSTIEQFRLQPRRGGELRWVRTWSDGLIATPNNVGAVDKDNIFFTNDHGYSKTGLAYQLSVVISTGNVVHCSVKTGCAEVATGLAFPNGLINGQDSRLYVPAAIRGDIHVFSYDLKNLSAPLKKDDVISTGGYFVDNLSQDSDGVIWAASAPGAFAMVTQLKTDPENTPPATVFRITWRGRWEVDKIVEDKHAEVLPGVTTVLHDSVKGRLLMSGVVSPFITVCDRNMEFAKMKLESWK